MLWVSQHPITYQINSAEFGTSPHETTSYPIGVAWVAQAPSTENFRQLPVLLCGQGFFAGLSGLGSNLLLCGHCNAEYGRLVLRIANFHGLLALVCAIEMFNKACQKMC